MRTALLTAVVCPMLLAVPAPQADARLNIRGVISAGGGTILPWEAADEIGTTYGVLAGVELFDQLRILVGAAGVLPDARIQGHFGTFWLEGQYHPFRCWFEEELGVPLSPYGLLGLGFALPDTDPATVPGVDWVRWSTEDVSFLMQYGFGVLYGPAEGFYVAADVRLYNVSHGGFSLQAGVTF